MAVNDVYTTHKCKICDSTVDEIPLYDTWGEHVLSNFACTNKECGMKVSECDDVDIENFVATTYHNARKEEDENLKKYYTEKDKEFSIQEIFEQDYFRTVKYFYCGNSKCRITAEGALQLFTEDNFADIDGQKIEQGWINCLITEYWLKAKFRCSL